MRTQKFIFNALFIQYVYSKIVLVRVCMLFNDEYKKRFVIVGCIFEYWQSGQVNMQIITF